MENKYCKYCGGDLDWTHENNKKWPWVEVNGEYYHLDCINNSGVDYD